MNNLNKYQQLSKSYQNNQNYCGCCGIELQKWTEWCPNCIIHVNTLTHKPPWDRTYFALNGKDCPFQIKS